MNQIYALNNPLGIDMSIKRNQTKTGYDTKLYQVVRFKFCVL